LKQQKNQEQIKEIIEKKQKTENFETAVQKARDKTKFANFYEEEYNEIEEAIEKQRRQA
jgi:hypothetical protein